MTLRINPIACEGIGMCAHVAPELIELDPWGYPIIGDADAGPDSKRTAERAVTACPRRALFTESHVDH